MLDDDNTSTVNPSETTTDVAPVRRTRRRAASRPAGPPEQADVALARAEPVSRSDTVSTSVDRPQPTAKAAEGATSDAAAKKVTRKAAAKKSARKTTEQQHSSDSVGDRVETVVDTLSEPSVVSEPRKKATKRAASKKRPIADAPAEGQAADASSTAAGETTGNDTAVSPIPLLFQPPDPSLVPTSQEKVAPRAVPEAAAGDDSSQPGGTSGETDESTTGTRRRRSRGGRNRRKPAGDKSQDEPRTDGAAGGIDEKVDELAGTSVETGDDQPQDEGSSRRRRRRHRGGDDSNDTSSDPANTVVRVRKSRAKSDTPTSVEGSTRIEAKKQRRREGREAGRRRPPILSESEFLARRESVERVMAIRQRGETTQIAVLEDNVLVEHYVALESQSSIIGNVYLGRVQNVLPSMEAAFIDIGKGRNAVLYAGEVNWDLRQDTNQPRRIENALKPGQSVLVQVSKDPIGHKGARLTSQINLPGRYLVYVPAGGSNGISRKLPDIERTRLKSLLKDILPDDAGVIIRTAAEGASEEELTHDVTRLTARWEDIDKKSAKGQAPQQLYAEPETTLKVVRDLFTEDFGRLVIQGDDAWDMVDAYVQHVAPDLAERLERFEDGGDVFDAFRIDEQIAKAMERKVWLPSGGSLVIDRTEAMTVVDVNTGKFTGSGGNLEETVTKNNLEAAEEMVRQLRLRDIGGIIVVDFIDMVLESNRDLVLRRLVECLGRDRTRHQVAEVTSLGLVQMTRKRISTGLLEAFSESCDHCQGRGVIVHHEPLEPTKHDDHSSGSGGSGTNGSGRGGARRSSSRRRGGQDADGSDDNTQNTDSGAAGHAPGSESGGGSESSRQDLEKVDV